MKAQLKKFIHLDWIPLISNKTKIAISMSLLIIALIFSFVVHPESLASKLCLLAMFFSFLGDISLNCMPLEKRPHSLMYSGAAFFMVAHFMYAYAYYHLISINSYEYFNTGAISACAFMALCIFTALICIVKSNSKDSLGIPMILVFGAYLLVIGLNFITICSYGYSAKTFSGIGALSFLISDFIIGIETVFKVKKPILRKLVWIFYPIGQILILTCH